MSIKSYISKEEIPHSNWNQNDPNGEGYIEGRICYTTDPIETVFFEEQTLSFINGGSPLGVGGVYYEYDVYETTIDGQLIVGDKYKVIIDGNEYVLECYDDDGPTLGEAFNYESGSFDFSIYSFSIRIWVDGNINYLTIIFNTNTSESRTVKIIHYTAEDIQLDRRYIKYIPGLKTEGNTYTINNESITSQNGAEIFNDYTNNKAIGHYAHAEGYNTIASGYSSHSEGYGTIAFGAISHAEGYYTIAGNIKQDVQSRSLIVRGDYSHAEGINTIASGDCSHSEGYGTIASGNSSHSEGYGTIASGWYSHAEGYGTIASEDVSHAEGEGTIASGTQQHVQGKYNIEDTESKYANIIGNGTSDSNRSNAHTVDWNGNAEYKGDVLANACGGENPISLINIYNKLQALLTVIESATAGQVIIADGNGGITAETIINGNEIEY